MPSFVRKAVPVGAAAGAIERGVLGRRARVWAPRYVGGALAWRGVMQPLFEQRAMRSKRLVRALDQARVPMPADPRLGIAVAPTLEEVSR
jgi:hypothetical protein